MSRHTTFKFCLDPTVEQDEVLARHAGAARFAFNQCLRIVKTALTERRADPDTEVPWTGFDLISKFNAWKKVAAMPWRSAVRALDASAVATAPVEVAVDRRSAFRVSTGNHESLIQSVKATLFHPQDRT